MISRLLACLAIVVLAAHGCARAQPPPAPSRTEIDIPDEQVVHSFAVSPDGERIVYAAEGAGGERRLYLVDVETNNHHILPSALDAALPFFSPDGAAIGYFAQGALWRVHIGRGDAAERIVDAPGPAFGATWTADGRVVFADGRQGLQQVAAAGGEAAPLTEVNRDDGELAHGWPSALPGGAVLFTVSRQGRDPQLNVVTREGRRSTLRAPVYGQAEFLPPRHLAYSYLGNLMAVGFDAEARSLTGIPATIASGIQLQEGYGTLGRASFSVSASGTLVWLRATPADAQSRLVRLAAGGQAVPLPAAPDLFQTPRLSPDGSKLAVVVRSGVMTRELRIIDAATGTEVLATVTGGDNHSPAWLDAARLTFASNREGAQNVYVVRLERRRGRYVTTDPVPLFPANPDVARNPAGWTRPPRLLALYEIARPINRNVLLYRLGGGVTVMAGSAANERAPAISRDGTWLAFVSDASGRDEVYVMPVDRRTEAAQLTSGGGAEPVWTQSGLYYRQDHRLMWLEMPGNRLELPGRTREWASGYFVHDPGGNLAAYDVTEDGREAIVLKSAAHTRALRVVRNWTTEVAAVLP